MRIAVFGLGYVGIVSAACLARDGHMVVGVDPQPAKINLVNEGRSPIVEQYVGELIADAVQRGRLTATRSAAEAVGACDMSLVCVGTPSRRNGSLDTAAVERVCEEIGTAVRAKGAPHLVVIRSTILPGTMRGLVIPALERAAGMTTGEVLRVAMNPEFLRELTAVYDYDNPPKTVVGAENPAIAAEVLAIYEALPGPKIATQLEVAEMVKYADNSWHAVKVAFGNEIGNIAKAVGVDSWEVMDIFCQDLKLNISPTYLRPGFAFGGSCLPKDVRALSYKGRDLDLDLPLLNSLMPTNGRQVERALEMIERRRPASDRLPRHQLQGRHRRPAREPPDRLGRAADRQRLPTRHLRSERASRPAGRGKPGLYRGGDPAYRRDPLRRSGRHRRPRRTGGDR